MIIVYHSRYGNLTPLKGEKYKGSDRELLSKFMGGKVGFAYAFLPESWKGSPNILEVHLEPETPVILSLNRHDVPRRDYAEATFQEQLLGTGVSKRMGWTDEPDPEYFIGTAAELEQFRGCDQGELVFLADGRAIFGDFVFPA